MTFFLLSVSEVDEDASIAPTQMYASLVSDVTNMWLQTNNLSFVKVLQLKIVTVQVLLGNLII